MQFIQYSRKSSEGDERQIQSIPDQNAALARLVEQGNLKIIEHFDESKSAKLPGNRPLFARMMEMITKGEADAILCWHLNRLSRNPVDSGQLSWMLQQGVIKCIKTPEREYRPEDNVVIMAVENAVANQYIIDLRRNIRRAQDEKSARGWFPHRPPAGYKTNPITKEIEVDPERFALLRRAWDLLLTDSYLIPEICEKLAEWGYRTHRAPGQQGKSIARSKLYTLFDNPFYYGEFLYRGERYVGRHQPMVTREEFEQVLSIIHRTTHIQPQKYTFAFTGLIRCGGCGCLVTAERKVKHYRTTGNTATYTYYRCTRSRPCSEPCVTERYIDTEIQTCLDNVRLDPATAAWAEAAVLGDATRSQNWAPALTLAHQQSVNEAKLKLKRILEMRMNEEISANEYGQLKRGYEEKQRQTERALERLVNRTRLNATALTNGLAFASRAPGAFPTATEKVKRQIATSLGEAYVLTQGKLHVSIDPLLRQISALEPPKRGNQRVRRRTAVHPNPYLWSIIYKIRTLLKTTDVAFPHVDFDQQVQNRDLNEASKPPFSTKRGSEETLAA